MRPYNEVVRGLEMKMVRVPEASEVDVCESFAAGFVAGAELDPKWVGDGAHWTFVSWAAYLAGRLDLVPPSMLATLAGEPEESKRMIRRDMGPVVLAADDRFKRLRRDQLEAPRATQVQNGDADRSQRSLPVCLGQEVQAMLHPPSSRGRALIAPVRGSPRKIRGPQDLPVLRIQHDEHVRAALVRIRSDTRSSSAAPRAPLPSAFAA